jgi:hypothetical protein
MVSWHYMRCSVRPKNLKKVGVVLKLDFEKAYDEVCWEFLYESMRIRGFNEKLCEWITQVVR